MKKFITLMLLMLFLSILASCSGAKSKDIMDYYGEYRFELPFNHTITNATDVRYFTTNYSMEQMTRHLNDAGYSANLYDNGNVKTILISAVKNEFTYYFIVYDKNQLTNSDVFMLSSATMNIMIEVFERVPNNYVVLAPIHVLGATGENDTKRVYASFDYIADFYRATGKNDVEIDDVNKVIFFECKGNPNLSWIQGTVALRYIENETGIYLHIEPKQ